MVTYITELKLEELDVENVIKYPCFGVVGGWASKSNKIGVGPEMSWQWNKRTDGALEYKNRHAREKWTSKLRNGATNQTCEQVYDKWCKNTFFSSKDTDTKFLENLVYPIALKPTIYCRICPANRQHSKTCVCERYGADWYRRAATINILERRRIFRSKQEQFSLQRHIIIPFKEDKKGTTKIWNTCACEKNRKRNFLSTRKQIIMEFGLKRDESCGDGLVEKQVNNLNTD